MLTIPQRKIIATSFTFTINYKKLISNQPGTHFFYFQNYQPKFVSSLCLSYENIVIIKAIAQRYSAKKGTLKNFAKFTRKQHLRLQLQLYLKRVFDTSVFLCFYTN